MDGYFLIDDEIQIAGPLNNCHLLEVLVKESLEWSVQSWGQERVY